MRRLLLLLAFSLTGCPPTREAPSPNPIPAPDSELCEPMCKHIGPLTQGGLGCEEGYPVYDSDKPGPKGVPNKTCVDFCTEQQANGVFVNPKCVMGVKRCEDIESARQQICQ